MTAAPASEESELTQYPGCVIHRCGGTTSVSVFPRCEPGGRVIEVTRGRTIITMWLTRNEAAHLARLLAGGTP